MSKLPGRLVILGHPVSHSLSPRFQNAALAAAGIRLTYETEDVRPGLLHTTLDDARREGWAGNVTVPLKEAVFARCVDLTPIARRVQAVNCFSVRDGGLVGHNTDVEGVRAAVRSLLGREPRDEVIGILGAGGAAAAVLAAVESWPGCRAIVSNRNVERAQALAARFESVARFGDAGEVASASHIVVNATSLGLRDDDPLAIEPGAIASGAAVLDLVYAEGETRLVREARASRRKAADGMHMLIAQGAAAFEWWFGVAPNLDVMWKAVGRPQPTT